LIGTIPWVLVRGVMVMVPPVKNTITRCGEFLRLWGILTSGRTRERIFTLGVIKYQAQVNRLAVPI
jgi:hypothetical protein